MGTVSPHPKKTPQKTPPKTNHLSLPKSYGPNDQLGTLNRLTDTLVRTSASREILTGVRINLDWPLDAQSDVPLFNRQPFRQDMYQKPPRIVNDDVWTFNTQSSSQWDGLRHFGYQREKVFYGGVTLGDIHGGEKEEGEEEGEGKVKVEKNGIGAWAEKGIVGRGILLDYHRWRTLHNAKLQKEGKGKEEIIPHNAFSTGSIPTSTLLQIAQDQGTQIHFGDILLIRTGYFLAYHALTRSEIQTLRAKQPPTFTGVEQSESMMEFLWENFSACAADHPSWEAWPTQKEYSLHEVMLAGWGMPIGELWDLEALARHCEEVGRWSFFLVSKPNYVPGGVASPPNVLAIF